MLREFKLPDVGEGLTEAEIVKWHVAPGDRVTVNQTIVEIETAKAVVELPCPFAGVVASLLAAEGETVDVGRPIIAVDTAPEGTAATGAAPARPDAAAAAPPRAEDTAGPAPTRETPAQAARVPEPRAPREERQAVLVGYGVRTGPVHRRPRRRPAPAPTPAPGRAPAAVPGRGSGRALAKPPVRKLAKDLGVDLDTLTGSGPGGTITREDVRAAATASPPQQAAPPARQAAAGREERVPVRGVRKSMADAMVASAFTAPQVTEFLQVDVTGTVAAVARLRELPEFAEVKVSPLLLVAKALITAAGRHPMINSSWDGDAITVKRYVNLGVAAATERGLVVPNIKDAQELSLPALARALADLTEKARTGRCTPADLTGGTITVTNVGVFGVDGGTPLLNPGEAAILAFGQIREMPWVVDGALAVRRVCTLSLSFDHRIVDGELGSKVLRDVGAMLEDPLRILAWE